MWWRFLSACNDSWLMVIPERRREWKKQSQKHWRKLRRRGVKLG